MVEPMVVEKVDLMENLSALMWVDTMVLQVVDLMDLKWVAMKVHLMADRSVVMLEMN